MTNRSIKRALLSSILALALSFTMLIGTTYAWFTDSVTSGSNVIQAGNLDLEVEYTLDGENWADLNGAEDLFQKGLWEPGHTEVIALRISNKGSLALKYLANMNLVSETVGKNAEGDDIVLSEILTVNTLMQAANDVGEIALWLAFMGENAGLAYESTVAFTADNILAYTENTMLLPGDSNYVIIKVDMPEDVGNEANYVGDVAPEINFGINVFATQYTYENDSFGNDYDFEATFDKTWGGLADTSWYNETDVEFEIENANQLAGIAKLVNTGVDNFAGKTIKLADDIDLLGTPMWLPIGLSGATFNGTFDGNGKTVSNLNVETAASYAGLFGYVAAGTTISNLTVHNATVKDTITGDDTTCYGAVVGYCPGAVTIDNVDVTGDIKISGDWYVGALIGRSKGAVITNSTVSGEAGSIIESGRWAAGISGYDNGAAKVSGCLVENVEIKSASYAGGIAALGAAGADVHSNSVKNVEIVLENASDASVMTYGTGVGGVSVYSYSAKPITVYDNTYENVICTVNGNTVGNHEIGSKYEDGTDQGLIMMPNIKVGNNYYTYMKKAFESAPKDGTQIVIELTGDTMITAKFKPSVAKGQNIVIKTNGYKLLNVAQDANKMPVYNVDGSLVTTVVTAENLATYIKIASGGTVVIE